MHGLVESKDDQHQNVGAVHGKMIQKQHQQS